MNQKTLTKLEFDKIISLLEEEAGSFRGRQLCRRLKPMTDRGKIDTFQEQTAAAFTRIVPKRADFLRRRHARRRIYETSGSRRSADYL